MTGLDKNHPIPLYYQLAEFIRERIQSGELPPGSKLSSERELGEQFQISRMTVRKALEYLLREGALVVKAGVGTFVSEPKLAYDAMDLLSFTEGIMRQGGVASSRILEQAIVQPSPRVRTVLQLAPGETTLKLIRLRLAGDVALLLETSFIPASLCPGLEHQDLGSKSLYALLEVDYGLRLQHTTQTFEATVANDFEADLFGLSSGTPMILLEGIAHIEHRKPVEYFRAVYRGDKVKFELESWRDPNSTAQPGTSRLRSVVI